MEKNEVKKEGAIRIALNLQREKKKKKESLAREMGSVENVWEFLGLGLTGRLKYIEDDTFIIRIAIHTSLFINVSVWEWTWILATVIFSVLLPS